MAKVGYGEDMVHEAYIGEKLASIPGEENVGTFVKISNFYKCTKFVGETVEVQASWKRAVAGLKTPPDYATHVYIILMEKISPATPLCDKNGCLSERCLEHDMKALVQSMLHSLKQAWTSFHFVHLDITVNNVWVRHQSYSDQKCGTDGIRLVLADYGASSMHCVVDDEEKCIHSAGIQYMSGRTPDLANIAGLAYDLFEDTNTAAAFKSLLEKHFGSMPKVIISDTDMIGFQDYLTKEANSERDFAKNDTVLMKEFEKAQDDGDFKVPDKYATKSKEDSDAYTLALNAILKDAFFDQHTNLFPLPPKKSVLPKDKIVLTKNKTKKKTVSTKTVSKKKTPMKAGQLKKNK